ncbi:MAG: flagella assembly protein FlgT middle domain-containing protein [Methylococcaceae bacterium]
MRRLIGRAGLLLGVTGVLLTQMPHAAPIVIDGKGEIVQDGSVGVSRNLAIQDAERKALQQQGVQIESYDSGGFSSMQTGTSGQLGETTLLQEGRQGDAYRVRALVNAKKKRACDPLGYRKKIAVTAFPALHARHVTDLGNIRVAYPQELSRILEGNRQFLVRHAPDRNIYENPALAPEFNRYGDTAEFRQMAETMDVQFVVAGVISDMEYLITSERGPWNIFYEVFDIPPMTRHISIDTYLYDGLSGAMLDQNRYEDTVEGSDVYFGSGISITAEKFKQSAYGQAVQRILYKQANDIAEKLRCLPLAERVIKISEGNIYMNAGTQSNVRVGDSFIVYHGLNDIPNQVYYGNRVLGGVEEPKATLTIKQVQPNFSVGYLDVPAQSISSYDIIRSW